MLGFYNYTVILTYLGLASSVTGIFLGMNGQYKYAFICMLFAALCDTFDGKVARTKKNRTESEKKFGIQIDSLCDVVCFSVTPAAVMMTLERRLDTGFGVLTTVIGILFILAGVIRLAYFNVEEEERQKGTTERRTYYRGFPVTGAAGIIPLIYCIWSVICSFTSFELQGKMFLILYAAALTVLGFLNIFDFKVAKPGRVGLKVLPAIGVIVFALILIFG